MTAEERLSLIRDVYLLVCHETESFELGDKVGPDLAYLLGAIASGTACGWAEDRPIVTLLRKLGEESPVWGYINTYKAEPNEFDGTIVWVGWMNAEAVYIDGDLVASTVESSGIGSSRDISSFQWLMLLEHHGKSGRARTVDTQLRTSPRPKRMPNRLADLKPPYKKRTE